MKDKETEQGLVVEGLRDARFKVKFDNREEPVVCYLAGKMRIHHINVFVGDRVDVVIDKYGSTHRIIRRL